MSLKILDKNRINLLKKINNLPFINQFALGGGTALSLQYTYRESYDFNFFTGIHFNADEILEILKEHFDNIVVIDQRTKFSTLNLYINDIQVSFFEYKYKPINPLVALEGFNNIFLLSANDILTMKCVAIVQRGSKKDFFDAYMILKEQNINPSVLKDVLLSKFGDKNLIKNLVFSIGYFEDAEQEKLPVCYVDYSWENIKLFFISYKKELLKLIK